MPTPQKDQSFLVKVLLSAIVVEKKVLSIIRIVCLSKYSSVPNRSPSAFTFFGFFPHPVCLIWIYAFNRFLEK